MSRVSFVLLVAVMLVAFVCFSAARNIQYDVDEMSPEAAFRYAQWGEMPRKRVPSAGDMMVRFGKRSI